jgi:hypothetical protein
VYGEGWGGASGVVERLRFQHFMGEVKLCAAFDGFFGE